MAVGLIVLVLGGYWLYTNDKLGPLSPSKEAPQTEDQAAPPPPMEETAPQPDTIKVLSPEEIPDEIPYKEPKPAFAG